MDNSYIENIKNGFPKIVLPLSETELQHMEKLCNVQPQTRFVSKSEKTAELEKELVFAEELVGRMDNLMKFWGKKTGTAFSKGQAVPNLWYHPMDYRKYETDGTWSALDSSLKNCRPALNTFANRVQISFASVTDMLHAYVEELSVALEIEQKGTDGESVVENYIVRRLGCRVLSNVVLSLRNASYIAAKTAETDLIVITKAGVFVCEIKNYGKAGQTLRVGEDGSIEKYGRNGAYLEDMGSPVAQNQVHCFSVSEALRTAGCGDVPVYSAVIIANADVRVENQSKHIVSNMYDFCDMVEGMPLNALNHIRQREVFEAIQAKRLNERSFPMESILASKEQLCAAVSELERVNAVYSEWKKNTEDTVARYISSVNRAWKEANPNEKPVVSWNSDWTAWVTAIYWLLTIILGCCIAVVTYIREGSWMAVLWLIGGCIATYLYVKYIFLKLIKD